MRVKRKHSDEVFEATAFDGKGFGAVKTVVKTTDEFGIKRERDAYIVEVDSPSGDKVKQDVGVGSYILEGDDGIHACSPAHFLADFEEVSNG